MPRPGPHGAEVRPGATPAVAPVAPPEPPAPVASVKPPVEQAAAPSPHLPHGRKARSPSRAFQGALAQLALLHHQEVEGLRSQVNELRHRLKQCTAANLEEVELALAPTIKAAAVPSGQGSWEEVGPAALISNGPASQADPGQSRGSWEELGLAALTSNGPAAQPDTGQGQGSWEAAALLSNSPALQGDPGQEPHPCAKPHRLPPTFWASEPREGGPGERALDSTPKEVLSSGDRSSHHVREDEAVSPNNLQLDTIEEAFQRTSTAQAPRSSLPEPKETFRGMALSRVSKPSLAESKEHLDRVKTELQQCVPAATKRVTKMRTRRPGPKEDEWSLLYVVEHRVFDCLCALMIIGNSALVGCQVEWATDHTQMNEMYMVLSHCCSGFFFVELAMRMYCYGLKGFFIDQKGRGRWFTLKGWNSFDFVLVVSSGFDIALSSHNDTSNQVGVVSTGMKTIKIMRIVRVFRVFRFFKELSLLALMIVDSMKSLGWAIVMVMIVVYVFAILFTDNAVEYLKTPVPGGVVQLLADGQTVQDGVAKWFGTLRATTYTLIQATLGGVSWGVVTDVLLSYDVPMAFLFFFYLAFTILAVLNIITGVFVDNAVETAQTQREFLVQKEMELKEKYIGEMRNLFIEMDSDGNGTVTLEEIKEFLEDPRIQSYFQALGLDPNDTERLFRLIDDDESGGVDVEEFLAGCLRLKGQARSIDIHALLHDLRKLFARLESMEAMMVGPSSKDGRESRAPPATRGRKSSPREAELDPDGRGICTV